MLPPWLLDRGEHPRLHEGGDRDGPPMHIKLRESLRSYRLE
jgi:hypothetical protein